MLSLYVANNLSLLSKVRCTFVTTRFEITLREWTLRNNIEYHILIPLFELFYTEHSFLNHDIDKKGVIFHSFSLYVSEDLDHSAESLVVSFSDLTSFSLRRVRSCPTVRLGEFGHDVPFFSP